MFCSIKCSKCSAIDINTYLTVPMSIALNIAPDANPYRATNATCAKCGAPVVVAFVVNIKLSNR